MTQLVLQACLDAVKPPSMPCSMPLTKRNSRFETSHDSAMLRSRTYTAMPLECWCFSNWTTVRHCGVKKSRGGLLGAILAKAGIVFAGDEEAAIAVGPRDDPMELAGRIAELGP